MKSLPFKIAYSDLYQETAWSHQLILNTANHNAVSRVCVKTYNDKRHLKLS